MRMTLRIKGILDAEQGRPLSPAFAGCLYLKSQDK